MDNNQNQNQQNDFPQPQLQGQNISVQNQANDRKAAPVSPVGSLNKEVGAFSREPIIRPSEAAPKLHPEVAEAGVETVAEKPELKEEHRKVGIEHAKESTPVKTEPSPGIIIPNSPMTEAKAREVLKLHKKISNSVLWMAVSMIRQIKKNRNSKIRREI
ncbi:hypothetical protein M1349_01770 [Patescibacteria group bacterium]|nr:hypothetical protein [Patescibacteria group bacterium]